MIRAANAASGRRIAVLDDDPTGSQTVHDVAVVTVFEDAEYAAGLAEPGSTCFVLTNTRSLQRGRRQHPHHHRRGEPVQARADPERAARGRRAWRLHPPRTRHLRDPGDISEIRAIDRARRTVVGTGFDGVLLVPAYVEAGRSPRATSTGRASVAS